VCTPEEKNRFSKEFVKVGTKRGRSVEPNFDELARLWNLEGCNGVTIFKKTAHHLQYYWKTSTQAIVTKNAKRVRIQQVGSSDLARGLIFTPALEQSASIDQDAAELSSDEEIITSPIDEVLLPQYNSCGTNTSPERHEHRFVNLDSLPAPSSTKQIRKRKACRTCHSETCKGINNRKEDTCPELQV
jgi:hypothetical protein